MAARRCLPPGSLQWPDCEDTSAYIEFVCQHHAAHKTECCLGCFRHLLASTLHYVKPKLTSKKKAGNDEMLYKRLQIRKGHAGNLGMFTMVCFACPMCSAAMEITDPPAYKDLIPLPGPTTYPKAGGLYVTKKEKGHKGHKDRKGHKDCKDRVPAHSIPAAPPNIMSPPEENGRLLRERRWREEEERRIFCELEEAKLEKKRQAEAQSEAWCREQEAQRQARERARAVAQAERERRKEAQREQREQQRRQRAEEEEQRRKVEEEHWHINQKLQQLELAMTTVILRRQAELDTREAQVQGRETALAQYEAILKAREVGLAQYEETLKTRETALALDETTLDERRQTLDARIQAEKKALAQRSLNTNPVALALNEMSTKSTVLVHRHNLRQLLEDARLLASHIIAGKSWDGGHGEDVLHETTVRQLEMLALCV